MNWPLGALIGQGEDLQMCSKKDDFAIEAIDISKCYRLYNKPSARLKQAMPWQKKKLYREFWALRDINFRLDRGKTLGVIGRNGSGKSTLLQLICGTLTPSTGRVKINGRIGALLELGSGFNPEFTGLENVRMNAAVLGLKEKEINNQLDAILEFAGIGEFINQPVKQYSSGMVVRLAFAVQAHIDPTILVVDEALAVGDELFQKKCFARLEKLKQAGTSILLVSHSCAQINQHCDQVLLLHKGQPKLMGDPHRITTLYQRLLYATESEWDQVKQEETKLETKESTSKQIIEVAKTNSRLPFYDSNLKSKSEIRYPANGIEIIGIDILSNTNKKINTLAHKEEFVVAVYLKGFCDVGSVQVGCFIAGSTGTRVTGQHYPKQGEEEMMIGKDEIWEIRYSFIGGLWPGLYFIGAGVAEANSSGVFLHRVVDAIVLSVVDTNNIRPIGNTDLSNKGITKKRQ